MPVRQKIVVQLGITEVQWNQWLLDFDRFCQSPRRRIPGLTGSNRHIFGTAAKATPGR
jgi:hypothetical protein